MKIADEKIAINLKRIMDDADLSPTQLSKITGVPRTTLIGIIDGRTEKMYWSTLYKIAKSLKSSMEDLIEGPRPRPEIHQVAAEIALDIREDVERLIIEKLSNLPDPAKCPNCGAPLHQSPANKLAAKTRAELKRKTNKKSITSREADPKDSPK